MHYDGEYSLISVYLSVSDGLSVCLSHIHTPGPPGPPGDDNRDLAEGFGSAIQVSGPAAATLSVRGVPIT